MAELIDFAEYLRWSDSAVACVAIWKEEYVRCLKLVVDSCAKQEQELANALEESTDSELDAVMFSPRVLWALTQSRNQQEITYEMSREFANRRRHRRLYSLDMHHSSDSELPEIVHLDDIQMDFDSSFELPGDDFQTLTATPVGRRGVEYQMIRAALTELRRASPKAFVFVKDLTYRIAIRSRPDSPRYSLSGSFTEYPGTMLLVNPWQAKMDLAARIDGIVHENIHHTIALFEAVRHDLIEGADRSAVHQSPWTGNYLTCHQFVEACFVWWGLYQMWLKWSSESDVAQERALALCDRALKGFRARPVTTLLDRSATASLPDDTVAALRSIEQATEAGCAVSANGHFADARF